jgi:hypothetical protein
MQFEITEKDLEEAIYLCDNKRNLNYCQNCLVGHTINRTLAEVGREDIVARANYKYIAFHDSYGEYICNRDVSRSLEHFVELFDGRTNPYMNSIALIKRELPFHFELSIPDTTIIR